MNNIYSFTRKPSHYLIISVLAGILCLNGSLAIGQSCPGNSLTTLTTFPNTYYPGNSASLSVGSTSISLGVASYGTTPIAKGDVLLIMQMQGAQIVATNSASYGTGAGSSGSGYVVNANMLAGNMEYVIANNAVPLSGGTLNTTTGFTHVYKNQAYDTTDGAYSYQVIRVPMFYDVKLGSAIAVPAWNGTSGGVMVLYAVDSINMNGQTIYGSGTGFRGGSCRSLGPGTGTIANTDFLTAAINYTNAPKGEGIAGTPRWVAGHDEEVEGYPGGSFARGAPGNAGGGGTDGNPTSNDQNTGGGGGGNGGIGGVGGYGWSSGSTSGGFGGSVYAQATPSAIVLGGGGGSGTTNNGTGTPSGGFASGGSPGGGIVIAIAGTAFSGTGTIDVSGGSGNTSVLNDGSGGGGAGGSAIIYAGGGLGLSNITVYASGGTGGSNSGSGAKHGPGGGGGGGIIYSNGTLNAASTIAAGIAGYTFGNVPYGATSGTSGTITQNIIKAQLSTFPVTCSLLAMNFVSVAAEQQDGQVTVNWTVSNEVNTEKYLLEKSLDGKVFTPVGAVSYKTAGSNINRYDFTDDNGVSVTGNLYYRVKEIEWTGGYDYSRIVTVSTNMLSGKLAVYPNPVSQSATVNFSMAAQGAVSLKLVDMKGALIWQTEYQATAGMNSLQLSAVRGLSDGIYFLQWSDGLKPQTVKLLVKH
jgi:hypothetical protein